MFGELPPEKQSVFFEVIRQILVDTTSNFLGVLDGVNPVNGKFVEFSVADDEGNRLGGELQDLFLQQEEDFSFLISALRCRSFAERRGEVPRASWRYPAANIGAEKLPKQFR